MRAKILTRLRDLGGSSISGLSRDLEYPIASIRDKLNIAHRNGHVSLVTKPMILETGQRVIIHEYTITEDGKKWLELAAQS